MLGRQQHNHTGQVGAALAANIMAKTKKEAVNNLLKPATAIVNEVLLEELTDAPCPSLPKPEHLARAANYMRQLLRPSDPKDLDFQLNPVHIPDNFLRKDITVSIQMRIFTNIRHNPNPSRVQYQATHTRKKVSKVSTVTLNFTSLSRSTSKIDRNFQIINNDKGVSD